MELGLATHLIALMAGDRHIAAYHDLALPPPQESLNQGRL